MPRRAYQEDQRHLSQFDSAITSEELERRQQEHEDIHIAWALAKALADKLDDLGIYWCGEISDLVTKLETM